MSIATEITRLQTAKSDIKTAIEGKGVSVPSTTKLDGYAALIDDIEQGGGAEEAPESDVNFYDYDGFRVASYTIAEAKALTALPTPPSHDGLTFQEWNWTLQDISTYNRQYIDVGANYVPTDGKTHIKATIINNNVSIPIIARNGACSINWGDETIDTHTFAGKAAYNFTHTYSQTGVSKDIVLDFTASQSDGGFGFGAMCFGLLRNEIWLSNTAMSIEAAFLQNTRDTSIAVSFPSNMQMTHLDIVGTWVNTIVIPKNTSFTFTKLQNAIDNHVIFPRKISTFGNNGYSFYQSTVNRMVVPEYTSPATLHQNTFGTLNAVWLSIPSNISFASGGGVLNLTNLRYIDIVNGWIPNVDMTLSSSGNWSADGMVDFFTKLGTTTTARTLTFGATNLNRLTADQKAIATNKGYTLA